MGAIWKESFLCTFFCSSVTMEPTFTFPENLKNVWTKNVDYRCLKLITSLSVQHWGLTSEHLLFLTSDKSFYSACRDSKYNEHIGVVCPNYAWGNNQFMGCFYSATWVKNKSLRNGHLSFNRKKVRSIKMFMCDYWFPVLRTETPFKCPISRRQVPNPLPAWDASVSYRDYFKLHLKISAQTPFRVWRYPTKGSNLTTLTTSTNTYKSSYTEIAHILLC